MGTAQSILDFGVDNQAYMEIPHSHEADFTGDLTIEFWLYLRLWPDTWSHIISKFESDKRNEFCFRLKNEEIGGWYYGTGTAAVPPIDFSPKDVMRLNAWTHFSLVRKVNEYGRIYVDGDVRQEGSWSGFAPPAMTEASIMVMGSPQWSRFHDGFLRNLSITTSAKTEWDIREDMRMSASSDNRTSTPVVFHFYDGLSRTLPVFLYNVRRAEENANKEENSWLKRTYDFLDFGCGDGASLRFLYDVLSDYNLSGLGIDTNPKRVSQAQENGLQAMVYNILDLPQHKLCNFVHMNHFLEHLGTALSARKMLQKAIEIANDFVFIRQPWFDADGFLLTKGLKFFWSDWTGHPNRMNTLDFYLILRDELIKGRISQFQIFGRDLIENSNDDVFLPLAAGFDQHHYKPEIHGSKPPQVDLPVPVYRELIVTVKVSDSNNQMLDQLLKNAGELKCLYASNVSHIDSLKA